MRCVDGKMDGKLQVQSYSHKIFQLCVVLQKNKNVIRNGVRAPSMCFSFLFCFSYIFFIQSHYLCRGFQPACLTQEPQRRFSPRDLLFFFSFIFLLSCLKEVFNSRVNLICVIQVFIQDLLLFFIFVFVFSLLFQNFGGLTTMSLPITSNSLLTEPTNSSMDKGSL